MKTQTDQQQKTHGKTTNHINNKDNKETNNNNKLVSPKAGILNQARRRPHSG